MLSLRTRLDSSGKDVRLFCLGALPRRPRTHILTGASRWTFGSIADTVKKAYANQRNDLDPGSGNLVQKELEGQDTYPPATFQQLTPDVLVLLDPHNDRLLYLVGVDEDARADHVIQRVRPLLRASAAPYLHLMALPVGQRKALLREFPGGWPIITQVPLPAELQAPGGDRDDSSAGAGRGRESRAGVLGFLYGSQSPSETVSCGADDEATKPQAIDLLLPSDMPDDVLSRRKKLRSFRRWLKGASSGVEQCRNNLTPYKFQQLIQGMNTFGSMTAFLASSRILMVRNNIADNMATDTDTVSHEEYLDVAAAAAQDYYEDQQGDDDDMEEEEEGPEEGEDDSIELSDLSAEDMKALEEILTAFSLPKGSTFIMKAKRKGDAADNGEVEAKEEGGDDDDDEVEEEEEEDADAETAVVEVGGDDDEEDEEDGLPVEVRAIPAPEPRRRRDWDDDTPFNVDMPLSHGPMGWRAALRVRSEPPASSQDLVAESLRADAEYLVNMQRLEALWHDQALGQGRWQGSGQAQEQGPGQGQGPRSRGPSGDFSDAAHGAEGAGGHPPGEALGSGLGFAGRTGSGTVRLEQLQPQPGGVDGGEGASGAVDAHGNQQQQQQQQQHTSAGTGGLEADWQQAESRAAAAATTTGRLRYGRVGDGGGSGSTGEALWGIPTDRLIRPIRRHAANGGAAEDSAGSNGNVTPTPTPAASAAAAAAGAAAEAAPAADPDSAASAGATGRSGTSDIPPMQTARTQPPSAMPQRPPSPLGGGAVAAAAAAGPTGFTASTRMRRSAVTPGPAHGGGGTSVNGTNSGSTRSSSTTAAAAAGDVDALHPQSQNGVVRPDDGGDDGDDGGEQQGGGPGGDLAQEVRLSGRARMVRRQRRPSLRSPESHSPGSATAAASAGPGGDGAGTSGASPRSPDTGDGIVPSTTGGGGPSGGGAVPVPAYKHLRPSGSAGLTPAGGTAPPGTPHAGVIKPPRGWASGHPPPGAAAVSPPQLPPPPPLSSSSSSEAAAGGSAAMDFEQLAHYILGRNATAEEVQDLARAVFQSTDVEEAFAAAAAPQPQPPPQPQPQQPLDDERPLPLEGRGDDFSGPGFLRTRWRRPGTGRPSVLESLVRRNTRRLHVVTPRRCRLLVPPQVTELARRMQVAAARSGGRIAAVDGAGRDGPSPSGGEVRRGGRGAGGRAAEEGDGAQGAASPSGPGGGVTDMAADALGFLGRFVQDYVATTGRLRPEATRVRVRGQLLVEYSMVDRSNELGAQHPPCALSSSGPSQEELVGKVVRALEAAAPLERKRVESLAAFLRGRRPQPDADGGQGWRQGLGGRGGLPGLVRGRDAVVVLPRALLEPAAGWWQRAEERLMHPDVQRARKPARG